MGTKRGRTAAHSDTTKNKRSATLKGRVSARKGQPAIPRSSQTMGLVRQPPDDPRPLLPLSHIYVACPPILKAARFYKLGSCKTCKCFACGASIAIRLETETRALAHPMRDGRPVGFIGSECCLDKFRPANHTR